MQVLYEDEIECDWRETNSHGAGEHLNGMVGLESAQKMLNHYIHDGESTHLWLTGHFKMVNIYDAFIIIVCMLPKWLCHTYFGNASFYSTVLTVYLPRKYWLI